MIHSILQFSKQLLLFSCQVGTGRFNKLEKISKEMLFISMKDIPLTQKKCIFWKNKEKVIIYKGFKNQNNTHQPNQTEASYEKYALIISLFVSGLTLFSFTSVFHAQEDDENIKDLSPEELEKIASTVGISLPKQKENESSDEWRKRSESYCFDKTFEACQINWWRVDGIELGLLNRLKNNKGNGLLLVCAEEGDKTCLENLLKKGIAIKKVDSEGNSPLHVVVREGRHDLIPPLKKYGFFRTLNLKKETPLHVTIHYGRNELIKLLIPGVDTEALCTYKDEKMDATMLSIALGQIKCFDELVKLGFVEFKKKQNTIGSLLHVAIKYEQDAMLKHILNKYAKMALGLLEQGDEDGKPPLSLACEKGNSDIIKFLVKEKNANPNAKDSEGRTPAHWIAIGAKKADDEDLDKYIQTLWTLGSFQNTLLKEEDKNGQKPQDIVVKDSVFYNTLTTLITQKNNGKIMPPDFNQQRPENLVFQGGGPRGLGYIGFLEAMEENGMLSQVRRIAGTSAGAITAVLFALGYSAVELKEKLLSFDLKEFLDPTEGNKIIFDGILKAVKTGDATGLFGAIFFNFAKDLLNLPRKTFWQRLNEKKGFCKGEKFRQWLDDCIAEKVSEIVTGDKVNKGDYAYLTFGDLKELIQKGYGFKHFYVYAMQIGKNPQILCFNSEDSDFERVVISGAIRASMSIPGVFEPYQIQHRDPNDKMPHTRTNAPICVDGGLIKNFPLDAFDNIQFQQTNQNQWNKQTTNSRTLGICFAPDMESNSDIKQMEEYSTTIYDDERLGESFSLTDFYEKEEGKGLTAFMIDLAKVFYESERLNLQGQKFNRDRIVEIPTQGVTLLDFDLTEKQKKALLEGGQEAAKAIIKKQPDNELKKINTNLHHVNPDFVGRTDYFQSLKKKISSAEWRKETPVYVISGPPGVGKTQIAMNFAKLNPVLFSGIWIVNCRTEQQQSFDYREIAKALKIPIKKNDLEEGIRRRVQRHLEDNQTNKPWLLILDNADQTIDPKRDIPRCGGCVLITTNKNTVCSWGIQLGEVGALTKDESIELLQKITKETASTEMRELAKKLGHFPFPLQLVANYVKSSRGTITLADYLTSYNKMKIPEGKTSFYEYTLETVWNETLQQLENECPLAMEWLIICSFLNPDQLPRILLRQWLMKKSESESELNVLQALANYFVIHKTDTNEFFSMHGMLQQIIRKKYEDKLQQAFQMTFSLFKEKGEEWMKEDLANNKKSIELSIKLQKWWSAQFFQLFQESDFINEISTESKTKVLVMLGRYAGKSGNFKSAILFGNTGLNICSKAKNPLSELEFYNILGNAYFYTNELEKAENADRSQLKILTELVNESNSNAELTGRLIRCKINLTTTLLRRIVKENQDAEKAKKVLEEFEEILAFYKNKNEWENEVVAVCLCNKGRVFLHLALLEKDEKKKNDIRNKALEISNESYEIFKKVVSETHPNTIIALAGKGRALISLKQFKDAAECYQKAYEYEEKTFQESMRQAEYAHYLGECHLGLALQEAIKTEKKDYLLTAERFYLKSLEINKLHTSEETLEIGSSLFGLGCVYEEQGGLSKALEHYEKAYKLYEGNQISSKTKLVRSGQLLKAKAILERIEEIKKKQSNRTYFKWPCLRSAL